MSTPLADTFRREEEKREVSDISGGFMITRSEGVKREEREGEEMEGDDQVEGRFHPPVTHEREERERSFAICNYGHGCTHREERVGRAGNCDYWIVPLKRRDCIEDLRGR